MPCSHQSIRTPHARFLSLFNAIIKQLHRRQLSSGKSSTLMVTLDNLGILSRHSLLRIMKTVLAVLLTVLFGCYAAGFRFGAPVPVLKRSLLNDMIITSRPQSMTSWSELTGNFGVSFGINREIFLPVPDVGLGDFKM